MSWSPKPSLPAALRRLGRAAWRSRVLWGVLLALCITVHAVAWGRAWWSADAAMSSFAPSGEGFESYSLLLTAFGRQYLRREARQTVQDAFAERARAEPRRRFVLGEMGWRAGGRLWPHASHRQGLSVDIFLPLLDAQRAPTGLSHQPWNLWGYCQTFDTTGRYAGTRWEAPPRSLPLLGAVSPCFASTEASSVHIDFEEAARLLLAIEHAAHRHRVEIRAIILAPEYLARVSSTPAGRQLGKLADKFVRRPVWIRHDEHLHIELALAK
ncbi:MAG: hypothetical protein RL685_879 [Pseudomonadota bacterium]